MNKKEIIDLSYRVAGIARGLNAQEELAQLTIIIKKLEEAETNFQSGRKIQLSDADLISIAMALASLYATLKGG